MTSDSGPEAGPWDTDRAPYQREMMDCLDDPEVYMAVYMLGVQLGKSETLLNRIGKNIHLDPAPMLFVFPDDENLRDFSKDRVGSMLEASPPLREKVLDRKKKTLKDNTIKTKRFPGGYLAMASARSAASLASRPVREVFCDEVDRFPEDVGKEGDPVNLAERRTTNFWNLKIVLSGSPTIEGESRIAKAYEKSDKRRWFCPCPHCGGLQTIEWGNVRWDKEKGPNGQKIHKPETARLECIHCGESISESERVEMSRRGDFIATAPFNGVAGFNESSLVSTFTTLEKIVREFLQAKDDPQQLKTFINTRLAQTYVEEGQEVKSDRLFDRREVYPAIVPDGAFVLTAGVDTQDDRLEITIDGWGVGEENWVIDHVTLWGSPKDPRVWEELDRFLSSTWEHESGVRLSLSATCIDSSGHHTQMVYNYCEHREGMRQFAIIGRDGMGRPEISLPSEKRTGANTRPVKLFTVGVDGIKAKLYNRLLEKTEPGPGFIHFPEHLTEEYFKQLTSEKLVKTFEKGVKKTVWKKKRPRNEALDCKVYSYAALKTLLPNWEEWREMVLGVKKKLETQEKRRIRKLRMR